MAAPPRAQDVLDFLTSHGFATAAAALEDDLNYLDSRPPHLPPVRIPPPSHHDTMEPSTCSSSVASDVFLSMNSSPSETLDPCGLWYKSDYSSEESDFGTARECKGFNVFSNCCSEDKFVMSLDEKAGQGEEYRCLFPLCDCCSGDGNSNSAVYGRYRIMPDETETLDEFGEDVCQLKRVDGIHDLNQQREINMLQLGIAEKEFLVVNEHAAEGSTLANGHPPCDSKASESTFMANRGKKEMLKVDWNVQLVAEKASQPDANDDHEPGPKDTGAVGLEGEDHGATDELQLHNSFEDEYEIFHLRIIHRKNRTGFEESKDLPIIMNSVIAGRYYVTEHLGSAAFSKVVQARDLHTGIDVCLKIIKNDKDFFDQSLDEIKLLKFVNKYDPSDECHILRLYDYFYHQEHLFIVCELLRDNLYEFQKYNQESGEEVYFTLSRIQSIARQCLEALEFLHHLGVIHCDLKPENILIKSYSRCEIKLIDLGSSCFQTDNLCLYVQSRSYRAPEVILYLPYDQKIDIWSLGCVLAELYIGEVLFPNDSLVMILARMIGILGPIDMEMLEMGQETHKYFTDDYDLYHKNEETDQVEYLIPEKSSLAHHLQASDAAFLDFLNSLLQINPKRRPTASQALRHHWLSSSYQ